MPETLFMKVINIFFFAAIEKKQVKRLWETWAILREFIGDFSSIWRDLNKSQNTIPIKWKRKNQNKTYQIQSYAKKCFLKKNRDI